MQDIKFNLVILNFYASFQMDFNFSLPNKKIFHFISYKKIVVKVHIWLCMMGRNIFTKILTSVPKIREAHKIHKFSMKNPLKILVLGWAPPRMRCIKGLYENIWRYMYKYWDLPRGRVGGSKCHLAHICLRTQKKFDNDTPKKAMKIPSKLPLFCK